MSCFSAKETVPRCNVCHHSWLHPPFTPWSPRTWYHVGLAVVIILCVWWCNLSLLCHLVILYYASISCLQYEIYDVCAFKWFCQEQKVTVSPGIASGHASLKSNFGVTQVTHLSQAQIYWTHRKNDLTNELTLKPQGLVDDRRQCRCNRSNPSAAMVSFALVGDDHHSRSFLHTNMYLRSSFQWHRFVHSAWEGMHQGKEKTLQRSCQGKRGLSSQKGQTYGYQPHSAIRWCCTWLCQSFWQRQSFRTSLRVILIQCPFCA